MPVYNAAEWLAECIDTLLAQTFDDWELIAVLDFSEDHSNEILAKYQELDERIHYFQNREKGIIPALTFAMEKAKGDYITRMDADDRMPADKLALFYAEIRGADQKTVVTGNVKYFSRSSSISDGYLRYEAWLNALSEKGFWASIYRECVIASPNWLVHRSFFEEYCPFSQLQYPEDYDMVFHWYKHGYKVIKLDMVTHYWREHSWRTSRHSADYKQPSFFRLKTEWFLQLEFTDGEEIQLIGAGEKGKLVAAILIDRNISFRWLDFNAERYNSGVLGHEVVSLDHLESQKKVILTVWGNNERQQKEISEYMTARNFSLGQNYWVF